MTSYIQSNQPVFLPDAAQILSAVDTGKIMLINTVTATRTYTLPAVAPGLHYTFLNMSPGVLGANIKITGGANSMQGTLFTLAATAAVANTFVNFITGATLKGDRLDIICDGTQWCVLGTTSVAGALTATNV